MLWKLLVRYLQPQRRLLVAVVVFQLAQSIASLYLPTLNADIIDLGVATGDTGYILRVGSLMLFITLLQIACAVTAVYFGAKAAMGMGRDLRGAIFTRVGGFSEQELRDAGAVSSRGATRARARDGRHTSECEHARDDATPCRDAGDNRADHP